MDNTNKQDQLKLYGKLHEIANAIDRIEKDATNTFHKYTYASEKAIKEALYPEFKKHKILFKFEVLGALREGDKVLLTCRYSFIDSETGAKETGDFMGEGQDSGDKATYKAITGAIKYILTSNFMIPTGDDPENEQKKGE